jgi:hypothetical protein
VSDAIDAYLDRLAGRVERRSVDTDRLVEEAEAHLRDAQDELVGAGVDPGEAAERAVRSFGGTRAVARLLPHRGGSLVGQAASAFLPLVALALLGTGVGGFAALNLHLVRGDLLPGGHTSLVAQVLVGVAGLVLLWSLWRQRVTGRRRPTPGLPARLVPATAVTVFGVAAVALAGAALVVATDDGHHGPRLVLTALALASVAAFYAAQLRRPATGP